MQEGFIPAQHDTLWTHFLATLQAECDSLAAAGASAAARSTLPFADLHNDTVLLLRHGALILDSAAALDQLYQLAHPPPVAAVPLLATFGDSPTGRSWARVVESNTLNPGAVRLAAVVRAAPLFPVADAAIFHCGFCGAPCQGWGTHILHDCPLLPLALLHALRQVAGALREHAADVSWSSTTTFTCRYPDTSIQWSLLPDADLTPGRRHPLRAYITWSGLVYPAESPPLRAAGHDHVTTVFLNAAARWLGQAAAGCSTSSPTTPLRSSVSVMDFATVLRWLLRVPGHAVVGPLATEIGELRPDQPHPPSPRPLLKPLWEAVRTWHGGGGSPQPPPPRIQGDPPREACLCCAVARCTPAPTLSPSAC